ncbi:hypothetical protein QJQ45_019088 [Haematococcus lacustris]|nr:hypothetical protein QJQ45_019088 [Haematococcus lacustris]
MTVLKHPMSGQLSRPTQFVALGRPLRTSLCPQALAPLGAVAAPHCFSSRALAAAGVTLRARCRQPAPPSRGLGLRCNAVAATAVKPAVAAVQEAHGFVLQRQQFIREYDAHMLVYKHKKTGAEVISSVSSDENKVFGVVFRTPVDNSCGIPHILEHSVLCGSRKYPIKEPFVELMKGSLNTFLNAFTYPDRTCYPVASTNTQDFYNLVDVYLDAVFHPRCISDPQVFAQEGWHLELDDPKADLTYKGVVFNEMKGVYSSPDSVYYRAVQQALFPDNTYRHDSGGDPCDIPNLSFEQFKDFHSRYYHPSNARFWFHGDDEPEERLRLLGAYLDAFNSHPVSSAVADQVLKQEARSITQHYAAGDAEEGQAKAYVGVNWVLTAEPLDVETELALSFLDYLMLGTNASPLRKALNDSGLGDAVLGGGMDDELKQPIFSVGLKGVAAGQEGAVEQLVLAKLRELEGSGFSATAVEAAVNSIEFSLRENNTGSFPRGLSLMLRAVGAWIYDRDPLTPLQWEDALTAFKARLASGENVFGPLIRKYLLDNNHSKVPPPLPAAAPWLWAVQGDGGACSLTSGLAKVVEEEERARLDKARSAMNEEQVRGGRGGPAGEGGWQRWVAATADAAKERQERPDPPRGAGLRALPQAGGHTRAPSPSLPPPPPAAPPQVPTAESSEGGATVLRHELFTNSVLYLEAALDMRAVPQHLLPLIPLFCRALTNMATQKESFIELTERIGRKTGGLSVYPYTAAVRGQPDQPLAYLMLRGKAMGDKAGDLLELMRDLLLTSKLDDGVRFKQMVDETKSGLESGWLGPRPLLRCAAPGGAAGARRNGAGAVVNMTADGKTLAAAGSAVSEFLHSLPQGSAPLACSWTGPLLPRDNELITVPTQGRAAVSPPPLSAMWARAPTCTRTLAYQLSGAAYVIEKRSHLGTSYLWDKVRVVGGAYGGFCSFDSHSGAFTYLSYRDPNLLSTVAAYGGAPDYLRNLNLTQEEITKAIIGTIGDVDSYQLPDAKGYSALSRWLLKVTDEERQQRRDQILATSLKDFREFGQVLEVVRGDAGRVVAVTSAEKAAEAVAQDNSRSWRCCNSVLAGTACTGRLSRCLSTAAPVRESAAGCRTLPQARRLLNPLATRWWPHKPPPALPPGRLPPAPPALKGSSRLQPATRSIASGGRALLHANPESHGVEAAAPVAVPGPGCRSDTAGPPSCTAPSSRSSQDLGGGKQAGGGAGGSCSPGIPGDQGGGEGAAAPTGPEGAAGGGLLGALSCRLCGGLLQDATTCPACCHSFCYDCIAAWLHSAAAGGRLAPDAPGPHCPVPGCGTWLGPSAFDTFRLTFDAVLDGLVRASFPRPGLDEQLAWRRQQREEAEALEACSAPPGLARRATCCPSS